jgi:hypothetical protein
MVNSILIIKIASLSLYALKSLVKNILSSGNYTCIFNQKKVNFNQAVQKCRRLNATVLVKDDEYENKFINET